MLCRQERGEELCVEVLHLIDEDGEGGAALAQDGTDLDDHVFEVEVEPRSTVRVDGDRYRADSRE